MELLAWAINIESGIELSHYLLIPVTIESHDILQVHIVTGADGLSKHWNVQLNQVIPIHGLHLSGRMGLGHDHSLIPISVEPHPKPEVPLLFLLKAMIILKPQVLKLVLALAIVDSPVDIILSSGPVHRCCHPYDVVLKIAQIIFIPLSTTS